jgi:serine/threonine protein kinase
VLKEDGTVKASTSVSRKRRRERVLLARPGAVRLADDDVRRDTDGRHSRHCGVHEPGTSARQGVDRRTDIWSFGCVLFLGLTGHMAFEGETVSDIVARILQAPEWSALPPKTPGASRAAHRCLERDGKRRLRDIGRKRASRSRNVLSGRAPASSGIRPRRRKSKPPPRSPSRPLGVRRRCAAAFVARGTAPKPVGIDDEIRGQCAEGTDHQQRKRGRAAFSRRQNARDDASDSSGTSRIWIRHSTLDATLLPNTENDVHAVLVARQPLARVLRRRQPLFRSHSRAERRSRICDASAAAVRGIAKAFCSWLRTRTAGCSASARAAAISSS